MPSPVSKQASKKHLFTLVLALAFGASPEPTGFAQNNNSDNSGNNASTNQSSEQNNNATNQTNNSNQSNEQNAKGQKSSTEFFDDGSEEDSLDSGLSVERESGRMEHPAAPSKWRTQELMMRASLPSYDKLQACQNEVHALAAKAINQELMLESRNLLTHAITKAPEVYHWCFYLSATQLDRLIDSLDVKVSFLDKYKLFINEMKGLWIHARALDTALHSRRYFGYIRARYISMMKEYFGRDLTVISAPLGDANRRVLPNPPKALDTFKED